MRSFVGIIIIILFVACTRNKSVQVSGRVETGDTVVYFQVNDSLHKFRLDEKHYFSGKIELEKGYPIIVLGGFMMIVFQPPQCYRSSSRSAPCRG